MTLLLRSRVCSSVYEVLEQNACGKQQRFCFWTVASTPSICLSNSRSAWNPNAIARHTKSFSVVQPRQNIHITAENIAGNAWIVCTSIKHMWQRGDCDSLTVVLRVKFKYHSPFRMSLPPRCYHTKTRYCQSHCSFTIVVSSGLVQKNFQSFFDSETTL